MPAEALAQAGMPSGLGGLDRPFLFESSKITLLCLTSMVNKVSNVFFKKKTVFLWEKEVGRMLWQEEGG